MIATRIRARAPAYWRYARENPSWVAMFVFARTLMARRIERLLHGARHRRPRPAARSILGDVAMDQVVRRLIADGVSGGLTLPDATVREIRRFADSHPCYSRDRQDMGFLPRDVGQANRQRERDVIAAYYFESAEDSPAVTALCQDPAIVSIATAYLGQDAILIRVRLWWSFPAERVSEADLHAAAQDKFHFDLNGWRTLKFFFYLTPIDERSGPHRCIKGSHRRRKLRQQLTLTVGRPTAELEADYGMDSFLTVTGPAGAGFVEDPFIFHTGSLCQDRPRLILELEYGPALANPSYRHGRFG